MSAEGATLGTEPLKPGAATSAEASRLQARIRELTAQLEETHLQLEAAEVGTWSWDIVGDRILSDRSARRIFFGNDGPESEILSIEGVFELIHLQDADRVRQKVRDALVERQSGFECDFRIVMPGHSLRWVTARGRMERNEMERPVRFSGVLIDITARKLSEALAREASDRLHMASEATGFGIWDYYPTTGQLIWDTQCRLLFGLSSDAEVTYDLFLSLLHPEDREVTDAAVRQAFASSGSGSFDVKYRAVGFAGGTEKWIHAVGRAFFEEGVAVRFVGTVQNISDQKKAEADTRRLAAIVESSEDAIVSKSLNGIITSWNAGAQRVFGYTAEEVIGKPVLLLIPLERQNEEPAILGRIQKGERIEHYETVRRRKDGTLINVSLTVSPIRDSEGRLIGASKIARDITSWKKTEEALRVAANNALVASRAKDDFLAALSHELRTPLNPVLLVASEAAGNMRLPSEIREDFDMICKNVELEARLIDDLLDLTRITRGKLSLEMLVQDVHEILLDAIGTIRNDAAKKGVEIGLRLEADRHGVRGDAVRLQQIFWNVLKNAVKFTPQGGRVTVRTQCDGERLLVRVADTGIGITAEELDQVFHAFSQGDHARSQGSHRFGGLGLGLAISRMLAESHDGRMWALSGGRDMGAEFIIELPLVPGVGKVERHSGSQTQRLRVPVGEKGNRGSILLIEDHEPTRVALCHLLGRRRFEVVVAGGVAEGRARAAERTFDLLISDIGLPDGTGYELMGELALRGIKGIALSGYGMDADVARSHAAGFGLHLTKPVHSQTLDQALAAMLGKQ